VPVTKILSIALESGVGFQSCAEDLNDEATLQLLWYI